MNLKRLPYILELCRKRALEGHLPVYRQLFEIAMLQVSRGVGYDIYHYAGMWDKNASWGYKCGFLSYRDYSEKIYELNERKFHGMSQYKPYEKAFFQQFSIPTAPYIGTLNEQFGSTSSGCSLRTAEDLSACLRNLEGRKMCLKLVEGSNGRGFKAYQVIGKNGELFVKHLSSGEEYSIDELFTLLMNECTEGWLIEEYIEQHPVLKAFNPSSLNTIRMFLYKKEDGEVVPLRSFLKTGKQGSLIDKTENGGACVFIDQETGVLLNGFNWSPEMRPLTEHPATGVAFLGVQIPFWKDAVQIATSAMQACVYTRFTGVDIAITEDGPMMVEMNVHPDPDCMPVLKLQTALIFST